MGLDQDSIMIIHMGGMFGDKESTLQRFRENYANLPENIKGRLVLENDEVGFGSNPPICLSLTVALHIALL